MELAYKISSQNTYGSTYKAPFKAALILGLISSIFSIFFIIFYITGLGGESMQTGMSNFAGEVISKSTWTALSALFILHQFSNILLGLIFFGFLWVFTKKLNPLQIIILGILWAIITAVLEYFLLFESEISSPISFWTLFFGHLVSGSVYPIFPLIRKWLGHQNIKYVNFAEEWSIVLGVGILALVIIGV